MTNFVTRWKAPKPKVPHRQYRNDAGSPLASCEYHGPRSWLLVFADGSSRVTTIRPTAQMVSIHNATQAKAVRARNRQVASAVELSTA